LNFLNDNFIVISKLIIIGGIKQATMKTQYINTSETPKLLGIWKLRMIERALMDPGITRAEIMALAKWQTIQREETCLVQKMPKL
jgi:hypothetical protein